MTTPEQRIAADLGLTTDDLERIVRDERARRLGPKLAEVSRVLMQDLAADALLPLSDRGDMTIMLEIRPRIVCEANAILAEIDRPINT